MTENIRRPAFERFKERIYETVTAEDPKQAQDLVADIAYWGGSDMDKISRASGVLAIARAEVKPRDETVKVILETGLRIFGAIKSARRREQDEVVRVEATEVVANEVHKYLRENPNAS